MTERSAYRTRARTELLDLLKNAPGKHFSAAEIKDHFIAENKPIGIFTLWMRNCYWTRVRKSNHEKSFTCSLPGQDSSAFAEKVRRCFRMIS